MWQHNREWPRIWPPAPRAAPGYVWQHNRERPRIWLPAPLAEPGWLQNLERRITLRGLEPMSPENQVAAGDKKKKVPLQSFEPM